MASSPSRFAYYNEIDPFAADWLRALIAAGALPQGEVDTRSVAEVAPEDVQGFRQCHFFAGIGGWAYALQLAEWPADRPVWTGSCPCQPFSSAGKQRGVADPRHLWPAWFRLIAQCRPPVIFGEQVEAAVAHGWLDLVYADLEGEGYAVGAAGLPAAGVGAPHLRGRVWFVADAGYGTRRRGDAGSTQPLRGGGEEGDTAFRRGGETDWLAHPSSQRRAREHALLRQGGGRAGGAGAVPEAPGGSEPCAVGDHTWGGCVQGCGSHGGAERAGDGPPDAGNVGHPPRRGLRGDRRAPGRAGHSDQPVPAGELGDPDHARSQGRRLHGAVDHGHGAGQRLAGPSGPDGPASASFWSPCDWLPCLDGKSRPVEPGTFPLAHGVPARVGRLRGYGNAIVPQVAEAFIRAYLAC